MNLKLNIPIKTSIILATLVLATACEVPEEDATGDSEEENTLRSGYVDVNPTEGPPHWPNPDRIPVCFERLDPTNEYQEQSPVQPTIANIFKVARIVRSEYARAGIGFFGGFPCMPWSKGIRVKIKYFIGSSKTDGFGRELDGRSNGVILNWAVKDDDENNIPAINRIINTALHEFGHALGLHHEMARPDNMNCPEKDYTMGWGELDDVQSLGDYVPNSIMSYCRDFGATELSEEDIEGIINYYNNPIAAILGGPRGVVNKKAVEFAVGGYEIVGYRFKIGSAPDIDCKDATGYSEEQSVESRISADLVPLGDGPVRLCVVGKDVNNTWQSFVAYTSWFWLQDLTPPSPNAINKSEDKNKLELYLDEPGITRLRYKFGNDIDCSDPDGYGPPKAYEEIAELMGETRKFTYPVKIDLLSESIDQSADLKVCIVAYDEARNVQSFDDATEYVHSFSDDG